MPVLSFSCSPSPFMLSNPLHDDEAKRNHDAIFLHELLDGSKATRSGHDAAMPSLISHQSALGP
ncbi:hypothetical protein PV403_21870 [Paenibacillus sp. GYB006]|uniref:hypothetical protein n=1 Tax=Paenibacillus sp. GYB006 TaxID=2994394 RepID=UPI002F96D7AF